MIHKYKLNGYNIALDVNSGTVHILDDISFEILDKMEKTASHKLTADDLIPLYKKNDEKDVNDAYNELLNLCKTEQLFSKGNEYKELSKKAIKSPIKAMCLNIAHDCNLRCEYCFAAKGDFGGERMLMPFEIGKKAIDFLIEKSGSRHNLEVDFFGGEPLMNFEVVKQIVKYARSIEKKHNKNFRFTITTNGLLLTDDKIDFINEEMSNVVLSLDGRKHINDRLRITPNSKGSYNTIVPKYQKLVSKRGDKDYYVRGTFTKYNLDFSKDVLHIFDLGFDQISVEPVVSDKKLSYSIKQEDLPRIYEEYETLSKEIIKLKNQKKHINFFHFMIDLDNGPCAIKRLRGCGCGNDYVAITPSGDIFPCHQFVGNNTWKMGSLLDNSFSDEIKESFSKTNVFNKEKCKSCWAKFYCSGGCNANNYKYENDCMVPHELSCKLQKKRIECAIMVKAAML